MRKNFRFKDYEIEISLSSRHAWSHIKRHKREYYNHFIWGKLSIIYGTPGLEPVGLCACCDSSDISEQGMRGEYLTVCNECGAIEQGYRYITLNEYEQGDY